MIPRPDGAGAVRDANDGPLPDRRDRVAAWTLARPLSVVLGLLCLWELASWAPNYLTWPLWADHDVFATAATSWDRGVLPYRDFAGNNFPGTIYLFWLFGKLFGFGWALGPSMYGFDAALVAALGVFVVAWSVRRFGRALPGLVGYGGFLGYYLTLDYSLAAQRDWQGPAFVVLGVLLVQASGGSRFGRASAALLAAVGLIIRPQSVLLLPAQAMAVAAEARSREKSGALAVAEWAIVLAAGVALGFLPLIRAGLMGDFRDALKVVTYGGKYNLFSASMFFWQMIRQFQPIKVDVVPLGILLLATRADPRTRSTAGPWIVAFLGVLLYRPMSPNPYHAYLSHPLMLVWAVLAAVLVQMILAREEFSASARLAMVLLVIGLGLPTAKPRFSNPNGSLDAVSSLKARREPLPRPTGYAINPDVPAAGYYEWDDYRSVLEYLRAHTSPETKVANCLKKVPAITGPTARLSPFPAESIAWVVVVKDDDAKMFADRLRASEDCVVVWSPAEKGTAMSRHVAPIFEVIESDFEPSAKFGTIEVWTRKGAPAISGVHRVP
jgi:hypothetical protein